MNRASLRADGILLFVAAIWGSGFIAQAIAAKTMGPLTFNCLRYIVGFALLAVFLAKPGRWRPGRRELAGGLVLGVIMTGAAFLQQRGVPETTAARAGFFTGLYVLLVPIVGLALGQRAGASHIAGAAVAAVGLWLLSGDVSGGLNPGDPYIIACAALWAVHVALTGKLAPTADALRLAAVQFVTVFVLSGAIALALPGERARFPTVPDGLLPMLYSGVFVIGVAFTLQIVGQRRSPPTHAAVIMSMEAVFAAFFGLVLLGEGLNRGELLGCGLMLAGCLLGQLWPHKRTPAELAELRDPVR
jgi:drug/metabolite transporter (DMT)-like permease